MIFEQSTTWNKDDHSHRDYFLPFNEKQSKLRLIYMCLTIFVGVTFQTVFFPVLNNLKDNTKKGVMKTSFVGLMTAAIIYTGSIFISVYAFGNDIHSDILQNVGENTGWETYILGVLFAIVGSLHIPLIFFVAKEALLIIVFTFFYTESEKAEDDEAGDQTHLLVEEVSQISRIVPKSEMRGYDDKNQNRSDNRDQFGVPTRSELNPTNIRSQLKKTAIIPNIDVSITQQILALNHTMLRKGGLKNYEEELKAAEGDTKEPSHRNLPLWLYLTLTIGTFVAEVSLACVLDDVSIIFGFVGAISISMLVFILPGGFYLKSLKISGEKGSLYRKIVSWIFVIFGFMLMIGGLVSVFVKLLEDDYHEEKVTL
jgi:amino acid permease